MRDLALDTRQMIRVVVLSARARKDLRSCPGHIVRKFMAWVGSVQAVGLEAIRQVPGYHDEPLKGEWSGHRSIRLSAAYRAVYRVRKDGALELAFVESVNKHVY
jgi:proteic killer suppression protein